MKRALLCMTVVAGLAVCAAAAVWAGEPCGVKGLSFLPAGHMCCAEGIDRVDPSAAAAKGVAGEEIAKTCCGKWSLVIASPTCTYKEGAEAVAEAVCQKMKRDCANVQP